MGTLASELGPRVNRLVGQPRLYVDANLAAGVVRFMRQRLHWDVVFVIEDEDQRRASDETHYRLARRLHRTLITMDRDFLDEQRFPLAESGGVIVLQAPDERNLNRLLARIDRTFFRRPRPDGKPPLVGQKIEVHPDWDQPDTRQSRRRRRAGTRR